MKNNRVTFLPAHKSVEVAEGSTLARLHREQSFTSITSAEEKGSAASAKSRF